MAVLAPDGGNGIRAGKQLGIGACRVEALRFTRREVEGPCSVADRRQGIKGSTGEVQQRAGARSGKSRGSAGSGCMPYRTRRN